MTSLV